MEGEGVEVILGKVAVAETTEVRMGFIVEEDVGVWGEKGILPSAREREKIPSINPRAIQAIRIPLTACNAVCIYFSFETMIGMRAANVEPVPCSVSTQILPFCDSTSDLAIESPTPVSPTPWIRVFSAL